VQRLHRLAVAFVPQLQARHDDQLAEQAVVGPGEVQA
jgi:hypothetical protein